MTLQSEIIGVETKAYNLEGMIYVVHGKRLFQVDGNHFFEFIAGNEVYGYKIRQLKNLIPIPHSELVERLSKLKKTIEEIM
jgi:hypothetical protein